MVRIVDRSSVLKAMTALVEGGIEVIEVTMTVPGAVEVIRELSRSLPAHVLVGAGTVTEVGQANAVHDAGAEFIVSPIYESWLIDFGQAHGVAVIPGCFTPSEIWSAHRAGADFTKVFPATSLGPQYIRDLRGPLPDLKLVPTGGVTPTNIGDWIAAGASAVGLGTALLNARAVASRDWAAIRSLAEEAVANVQAGRAAPAM